MRFIYCCSNINEERMKQYEEFRDAGHSIGLVNISKLNSRQKYSKSQSDEVNWNVNWTDV